MLCQTAQNFKPLKFRRDENKNAEILLPQGIVESVVHESVILDSMQTNKKDSVMTLSSESIKE